MRSSISIIIASAALAVGLAASSGASAQFSGGGGGRDKMGDTYIDDIQKNPRFMEPGAQHDPARYRIGAPREGYIDREAASQGYYSPDSGYYPVRPRSGRVTVEPYYYGR